MTVQAPNASPLHKLIERVDASAAPGAVIHLVRALAETPDPALSHEQAGDQLPGYVAAEMAGLAASQLYPQLKHHLDVCRGCEEQYLDLLSLAQHEGVTVVAAPEQKHKAVLSFLPEKVSLLDFVRSLAQELVPMFSPEAWQEFRTIADAFFAQIGQQGGKLVPARMDLRETLNLGEGALPDAALILAATQLATQSIGDVWPQEREAMPPMDALVAHAERAARKVGLDPDAAHEFARTYAERILRDPDALRELAGPPS